KNDLGKKFYFLFCICVYDFNSCSATFGFVKDNRVHDRLGSQSEVARLLCPGNGYGVGAVITSERTAPLAEYSVLTLHPALFDVDGIRFRQVCTARTDDMTIFIVLLDRITKVIFYRIEGIRWQVLS